MEYEFRVNQMVRIISFSVNNVSYAQIEKIDQDGYIKLRNIVFLFNPTMLEPIFN
jgi:hypothetical protein